MKTQIIRFGIVPQSLLLAGITTLILVQTTFAQTPAGPADARLDTKVKYSATQASVQDIVQELAQQAGLKYDRQKSRAQTDPICRHWVRNVSIDGKPCRNALEQILKPVGLRYQVDKGAVVLSRVPVASPSAGGGPGEQKLEMARKALTGTQKDTARAKKLLLEIVGKERASLQADSLCYALVYLGYIEDRTGNRKEAIAWYKQALEIRDGSPGIRECAEIGLKQPMTWIRHLDAGTPLPEPAHSTGTPHKGKGYVTTGQPPADLSPAETLSPKEQRENFDFLCKAIDETYAGFELKSINWDQVRLRYHSRLDPTPSTDEFYRLLFQLVSELKDTHCWLQNYRPSIPDSGPGLSVDLFEGKPFVVAASPGSEAANSGVKAGSEVLEVDGMPVENRIQQLRTLVRGCSTERAFRREACRYLLAGKEGSTVALKLRPSEGGTQSFTLKRTPGLDSAPPQACPLELTRQRFVHFGRHPSGLGYVRIVSFDGRQEIAEEFDHALESLRTTPALILDIRDNPGGYGHPRIVGRFLQKRALGAICYRKNGPGHKDLERQDDLLEPTGPWQYSGPVALLVNDITGSAADLFACCLRSAKRVVTVGSTTHGNLSGVAAYVVLPCGLIVRVSNGYVCDATGKPIEGVGNEPDVAVTPTITDFLAGKDPALEKAMALLSEKLGPNQSGS